MLLYVAKYLYIIIQIVLDNVMTNQGLNYYSSATIFSPGVILFFSLKIGSYIRSYIYTQGLVF